MSLTLGSDPGQSGALAILDAAGHIELLADLPLVSDRSLVWIDGSALQSRLLAALGSRQCHAWIERVSSMPRQGIASALSFGCGFGSLLGVVQALHLPLHLVTPHSWKKTHGLTADKKAALHKARFMFPTAELHLARHDGRAESLLIADYGRRQAA